MKTKTNKQNKKKVIRNHELRVDRPSWDEYYIEVAKLISRRATCPRKSVGSVIVKDNKLIAAGYNGAPKKMDQCNEVGCLIKDNHCVRVLHSEMNCLLQAGERAQGATLYATCLPCEICFKLCIQAGIKRIVYIEDYNRQDLDYWISHGGIEVIKWSK